MKPGFYLLYKQTKRLHLPPSSNEFQPFLFSLRDICDFDSYISYKGYFTFIQFPIHRPQTVSVLVPVPVVSVQPAAALRL